MQEHLDPILKIAGALAAVYIALSSFADIKLTTKLKVLAVLLIGIISIGILCWPLVAPEDPFGVVSLTAGSLNIKGIAILAIVAFVTGLISSFISRPKSIQIAPLAVPAGLAVWAIRSGNVTYLMRKDPTAAQRFLLFKELKWEPIFWLIIISIGFAGVLIGLFLQSKKVRTEEEPLTRKASNFVNTLIVVLACSLIAYLGIKIFAQNVMMPDNKFGSVLAQPATGQIVFAVITSFAVAGFLSKKFLDTGYIWPITASALVPILVISSKINIDAIEYLTRKYPAVFFPDVIASILPIQMAVFAVLGSIAGYWLAVSFDLWRKQELNEQKDLA